MHEPPEDEPSEYSDEPTELEQYLSRFSQGFKPENEFEGEEEKRSRSVKEALDSLEKITDIESADARSHLRNAATVLDSNLELDPELRVIIGNLRFHLREFDAAESHFRTHLEEHPDQADAWYNLGKTLLHKGEPQEALDALEHSYSLDPDYETLCQMGNAYRELSRFEESIDALGRYLEQEPEDFTAYFALGRAYGLAGEIELAIETFANAHVRAHGNPKLLFDAGVGYRSVGAYQKAETVFLEALELFPCTIDARLLLAETQIQLEKYDESEKNALIYCKAQPKSPHGWHILGVAELSKKSYALAEAAFKEFSYLDEANEDARHFLFLSQLAQRKYEEAGRTLQECAEREGSAWLARTADSLSSRDLKNAEYCLQKCINEDTTNVRHWSYLLNFKLSQGKSIDNTVKAMTENHSIDLSLVLLVL